MGVRFAVGKLVELVYYDSLLQDDGDIESTQKFSLEQHGIEFLKRSLGHPLKLSTSVLPAQVEWIPQAHLNAFLWLPDFGWKVFLQNTCPRVELC